MRSLFLQRSRGQCFTINFTIMVISRRIEKRFCASKDEKDFEVTFSIIICFREKHRLCALLSKNCILFLDTNPQAA